jgi:hypothetical protein
MLPHEYNLNDSYECLNGDVFLAVLAKVLCMNMKLAWVTTDHRPIDNHPL